MSPPIGILKGYFLGVHIAVLFFISICFVIIRIIQTKRPTHPISVALVAIIASALYYEFDIELISKTRDKSIDLLHCLATVGMPCFWTLANPSILESINDTIYNGKLYYPGLEFQEKELDQFNEIEKCGKVCIFVICHDELSCLKAMTGFKDYPWARIYKTPDKNNPLLEGYMHKVALWTHENVWCDSDFVGTISYNLAKKVNMEAFLKRLLSADAKHEDVIYFLPGHGDPFGGHAKDERVRIVFRQLLAFVGLPPLQKEDHVWAFCNFWMARPVYMRMYLRFFTEYWLPALETHPLVWEDSVYRDATLSKEKLLALTGKPYYPLHTFLNERLPSVFFTYVTRDTQIGCSQKLLSANYGPAILDWCVRFGVMGYFTSLQGSSISIGDNNLGPAPLSFLEKRLRISFLNESAKVDYKTYNEKDVFSIPLYSDMISS